MDGLPLTTSEVTSGTSCMDRRRGLSAMIAASELSQLVRESALILISRTGSLVELGLRQSHGSRAATRRQGDPRVTQARRSRLHSCDPLEQADRPHGERAPSAPEDASAV